MTNPYLTQLLAEARIDALRMAGAARAGGVYVVTRDRRAGRIRAWWDAQLRRPRRSATRPAAARSVATCSR